MFMLYVCLCLGVWGLGVDVLIMNFLLSSLVFSWCDSSYFHNQDIEIVVFQNIVCVVYPPTKVFDPKITTFDLVINFHTKIPHII